MDGQTDRATNSAAAYIPWKFGHDREVEAKRAQFLSVIQDSSVSDVGQRRLKTRQSSQGCTCWGCE